MKGFHHLDYNDVRAGVDELVIDLGGVGPTPGIGKGMEPRLAHLTAGFAEEDVVVGVRIEWRIEINQIDAGLRELARVAEPVQIVAEVKTVHVLQSALHAGATICTL